MKYILRTGINLRPETRRAWENAGFQVVPSTACWAMEPLFMVNYGSPRDLSLPPGSYLLNHPGYLHRTRVENLPQYCGQFMPLVRESIIVKHNGAHGKGKTVVQLGAGANTTVQRFIHPADEYRVITWDIPGLLEPEVLAWSKKEVSDPNDPRCEKAFLYRPTYDIPEKLKTLAMDCHARLGLNFVGWDFLLEPEKPSAFQPVRWHLIEANSAPGIGEQTSKRLKKRLHKVFGRQRELVAA